MSAFDLITPIGLTNSILIVDDDPLQRLLQQEILQSCGFDVVEAGSGSEALQALSSQPVDLVLLDKCLPDMDGNEVSKAIREELGEQLLPIIMVTGDVAPTTLEASLHAGANDFIHKPYELSELVARVKTAIKHKHLTDQLDTAETVLFTLARMVEAKDPRTAEHCARLAKSCRVFGTELGLPQLEIDALCQGAVLHDIGKVGVPDSILLKPGKLNNEEWAVMQRHPLIGAHLCSGLNSVRNALPIILHHHERWNGSGYPHRLAGEEIPKLARVFQLADIYDALRNQRPYCEAMPVKHVIEVLEQELEKGWRDQELTEVFLDILRHRAADLDLHPDDSQCPGTNLFQMIFDQSQP